MLRLLSPLSRCSAFKPNIWNSRSRSESMLASLRDTKGSYKKLKRVGRGPGSGMGKTSTRGHKGQKARSGNRKPTPVFEGGQTPITRLFPKVGFKNPNAKCLSVLNLDKLQQWIDEGRLDASKRITMKHLLKTRCVHVIKDGVKLLGAHRKRLKSKIEIHVSQASKSAIGRIEYLGGKIVCEYYNKLNLRALLKPEKFNVLPRRAMPTHKRDIEYYTNPEKRGCLVDKRHLFPQLPPLDPVPENPTQAMPN
ncbi:54S ribosomal protein L10, mitochondrial [Neolecta irregularis DAH-3]|uniref:54S ribosomal protein L10, mitochondrial n=1 Tax=Neolecta irregularis (strain DAH-3) TaxID=1198029 RepID=A0A1U7LKQ3_NEOID|nr:54S ribosomal protein L10, mitochondrial [Neolecta irregularis DAH-3]|eukprot:OLL23101.1 54S ribosomal protein L10, mitochondrial [Neolecta irregularis DAH-3]